MTSSQINGRNYRPKGTWTSFKSNYFVNFYFRSSKPKTYQKQLMIKNLDFKVEKHRYCPEMCTVRNTYICEHDGIRVKACTTFFNHHAIAFTCPFCTKAGPPECLIFWWDNNLLPPGWNRYMYLMKMVETRHSSYKFWRPSKDS